MDWLRTVPSRWEVGRLKRICRFAYGDSLSEEIRRKGNVPVFGSNGPIGFHVSANTNAPCIVVGRKGSFGKVNYSCTPVFAIDTTFFIDARYSSADIRWLYYLLRWLRLDDISRDSAVPGLNREESYRRLIPIPPRAEQTAIALFLNHAVHRIQRYVAAKQRLIALLTEQRQTMISQVVAGQINVRTGAPYSAYKPYSSTNEPGMSLSLRVDGKLPTHWDVMRLRNVANVRQSNVDKHSEKGESQVRLCNYVDVYHNDRITSGLPFMQATATTGEIQRFGLRPGDVLITKDSEIWNDIAVPALVEEAESDVVCGYHLALLRPFAKLMHPGYLYYALQSPAVASQFHVRASGVIRFGLTLSAIKAVSVPRPPLDEQAMIVSFLDRFVTNLDRARRIASTELRLGQEFSDRLVSDATSGKLDVRVPRRESLDPGSVM